MRGKSANQHTEPSAAFGSRFSHWYRRSQLDLSSPFWVYDSNDNSYNPEIFFGLWQLEPSSLSQPEITAIEMFSFSGKAIEKSASQKERGWTFRTANPARCLTHDISLTEPSRPSYYSYIKEEEKQVPRNWLVGTRSQKLILVELGFKLFAFQGFVLFPWTYFWQQTS